MAITKKTKHNDEATPHFIFFCLYAHIAVACRCGRATGSNSDFLDANFLSDDKRYSVSELGTNIGRAMGTNAIQGHVWEEFSSQTYKDQPAAAKLTGLYNPVRPNHPIEFQPPAGGRGYYRVPTLSGVWATAPYFHNNSLGLFNSDPTITGRLAAFSDGMEKLLWPEKRLGIKSMWTTTVDSSLPLESATKRHAAIFN